MNPGTPLGAITAAWTGGHSREGHQIAVVNGDVINSNEPRGVLNRLETWIRRNDIGAAGKEVVVTLVVNGNKCLVLTPVRRSLQIDTGFPPRTIQNFDVKLWNNGVEYDCSTLDMMTMIWDWKEPKKEKTT